MDGDGPGLALHFPALPGQVAELLAVDLQSGVHGGHLHDLAAEAFQHLVQCFWGEGHFLLGQDGAGDGSGYPMLKTFTFGVNLTF